MDFIPSTFDNSNIQSPILLEIIKLLVCFIGAATDILIIYVILKSKTAKSHVDIYVTNWLLADALLILVIPAEYDVMTYLDEVKAKSDYICIFHSLSSVVRTVELLSLLALMFQCLFDRSAVSVFDNHSLRIVTTVWLLGFLELVFIGYTCLFSEYHTNFGNVILPILLIVFINSFLVIHCRLRCANPYHISLVISLVTTYIAIWSLVSALAIVNAVLQFHFFMYIYKLIVILAYLYPISMFYLFFKIDKDFDISLRHLLNRELEGKEDILQPQETEMEEIKINE